MRLSTGPPRSPSTVFRCAASAPVADEGLADLGYEAGHRIRGFVEGFGPSVAVHPEEIAARACRASCRTRGGPTCRSAVTGDRAYTVERIRGLRRRGGCPGSSRSSL